MHRRLGSATLSELAPLEESDQNIPWEKSHSDNRVVEKKEMMEILIKESNSFDSYPISFTLFFSPGDSQPSQLMPHTRKVGTRERLMLKLCEHG